MALNRFAYAVGLGQHLAWMLAANRVSVNTVMCLTHTLTQLDTHTHIRCTCVNVCLNPTRIQLKLERT